MHRRIFTVVFLLATASLLAQPDPAARPRQELVDRENRELAEAGQAEEQERGKLRLREGDEFARIQRDAATGARSPAATDTDKLIEYTFAQDEVRNLIQNQLGAEITVRFKRERNRIRRESTLARARLDAEHIDAGTDTAKRRDEAVKAAELAAQDQEQLDNLAREEETEAARLRFTHTTLINAAERDLAALSARLMMAQINRGSASTYNPAADPEIAQLSAARDSAKKALDTALAELSARFNLRRTEIENARKGGPAKAAGS